jgi:hypothetical protein
MPTGRVAEMSSLRKGMLTGAAWLSSARVVRCWVKSRNERNPLPLVASIKLGTLEGLPVLSRRKVGMTSSPHGPYVQGYTRATMVVQGKRNREVEPIPKNHLVRIAVCNSTA